MGISISCKKTKTSYDLGCGGFFRLRKKVADICCPEFGKMYSEVIYLRSEEERNKFDQKLSRLINNKAINEKVVDFCFQPDTGGSIRYGVCKKIYDAIKGYDDDICYGYAGRPDFFMFQDFKKLLKECYDNKSSLVWW